MLAGRGVAGLGLAVGDFNEALARANDPPPGNIVMWRRLSRLTDIGLGAIAGAEIVW